MNRIVVFAVLLLAGLAGCEDPAEPLLIGSDEIALEFRDIYLYENGSLVSKQVEFSALVSGAVEPAYLDSIAELVVEWPNGVTHYAIPSEFRQTQDGRRKAWTRVPREEGLFNGTYELTARFVDGREVKVHRDYVTAARLEGATGINFHHEPTWATIAWRAPDHSHDWSVHLERRAPEPVDTLAIGPWGSASGGGFGAGFDYDFEAGVTYAFVLELRNDYTLHSYAQLFQP